MVIALYIRNSFIAVPEEIFKIIASDGYNSARFPAVFFPSCGNARWTIKRT